MSLIVSADFNFIRKVIDASLNESSLPDPIIGLYLDESEEWVSGAVDVDGLSDSQVTQAKRAACYYCASLIAPTVNIPTSDGVVGTSYTRQVMKPAENTQRLLNLAEGALGKLTIEIPTSSDDLQYVTLEFETP